MHGYKHHHHHPYPSPPQRAGSLRSAFQAASSLYKLGRPIYDRIRHSHKHTRARQKQQALFKSVSYEDVHSGKSKAKAIIVLHKKKHKGCPRTMTYHQQNSGYFSNQPGQQSIVCIAQDFTVDQMAKTVGSAVLTGCKYDTYAQPLFNFNPYKLETMSVATQAAPAAAQLNNHTKMYIKSIKYEFQFSNVSTCAGDVILYCLTPKKVISQQGWTNSQNNSSSYANQISSVGSPIQGWLYNYNVYAMKEYGGAAQGTDISGSYSAGQFGTLSANTHGFSPFQFTEFRKMYKGLMKKEITLAPGAIQKYEVHVHVNKWLSEESLILAQYATSGVDVIPGLSLDWEIVIRGSPVVIDNNGSLSLVSDQSATLGQCGICYTVNRKIEYGFKAQEESLDLHGVMPTFYVPTGTSTQKIISAVDTVITNVQAT